MITFGAPIWFWGFAIVPVLIALYVYGERRSAALLRDFVAPRLLSQLAGNIDRTRRAVRFSLALLAIVLAIVALAKLRWGYIYEEVKHRGLDVLIAIDTSRSMLSNDIAPNRLERTKLAAQDLVNELNGDRVGLVAFAGRAFVQAPLTIDYDAAVEAINDLDTKTIPEGGTNISEAIALATKTFTKSATGNHALIIFTDGEELSGDAVKAAKTAAESGVRIFTIGVGTPQGSLIPLQGEDGNTFVKDQNGQVVKSKLDEARLREIAQGTGGIYLHLEPTGTVNQLVADGLRKMQAAEFDARMSRRPIERYEWPLGAAIIALITSLFVNDRKKQRRPRKLRTLEMAAAALLLIAPNIFAVAPGIEAYQKQKYDEALKQFQDELTQHPQNSAADKLQFDSGAAAYKLREYDRALLAFSESLLSRDTFLQSKGHYNLGNTLYQRGEQQKSDEKKLGDWTDALKHYEQTLKIEPQNKEAKENYEFVKKKIDELKNKQPPSPTPSPSPPPQQQQQKKNQQQDNKDQQKQDKSQNNEQQQQQQQQQQNQQSNSSSQQQQNQQQQNQQQQNSDQQKNENKAQPSPSAGEPRTNEKQNEQGGSPSPSPGKDGEQPSPSPSAGNGEQPSPSPSGKREGKIESVGDENNDQPKNENGAAEAEADQPNKMSPQQAERLLRAMKDEEARVQLDERRPARRVYKDW